MDKPVMIICATELGKVALEIFKSNNVVVYGFLDDNKKLHHTEIEDVSVLGSTDDDSFLHIIGKKCDVFVASDDNSWRANMIKNLRKDRKVMPVNAIHESANIAQSAILHHGCLINQNAMIGARAEVGNHCIVHSSAIIDYSAKIGDFSQIGAGSIINAAVRIADNVFIGSGVTIVSGISIAEGARVGAGSVVISNVKKNETVFGNPATVIEKS